MSTARMYRSHHGDRTAEIGPSLADGWLPGYREHPSKHSTYSDFEFTDLPPIDQQFDDGLEWLRAHGPVDDSLGDSRVGDPKPAREATSEELDALLVAGRVPIYLSKSAGAGPPGPGTRPGGAMALSSISYRSACATIATILTLILAACGGTTPATVRPSAPIDSGGALPTPSASASPAPDLPRIAMPVAPGSTVEGLVEVDGHDIYARCAGEGSPTVLYFTGWAGDPGDPPNLGVAIASGIESALGPAFRVCSYERRNTGRSETVAGTQSPEDVIADVDGFLAALGEDGPFLLLGASFGGLVASAYAVAHPDRVAGVVLLDASTGVDYDIDEMNDFQGMCLEANRQADAFDTLEKLDNCSLAEWIRDRRDLEPDMPLLYLAAQDPSDRGTEAEDAVRTAWVESWSPGTWRVVSAPHWMDEADTELVAAAVREVIGLTQ